jgi:hypothetical protein
VESIGISEHPSYLPHRVCRDGLPYQTSQHKGRRNLRSHPVSRPHNPCKSENTTKVTLSFARPSTGSEASRVQCDVGGSRTGNYATQREVLHFVASQTPKNNDLWWVGQFHSPACSQRSASRRRSPKNRRDGKFPNHLWIAALP